MHEGNEQREFPFSLFSLSCIKNREDEREIHLRRRRRRRD